jgi:hypothetical protein
MMRREPATNAGQLGGSAQLLRAADDSQRRRAVLLWITQNGAPTGSVWRISSHGARHRPACRQLRDWQRRLRPGAQTDQSQVPAFRRMRAPAAVAAASIRAPLSEIGGLPAPGGRAPDVAISGTPGDRWRAPVQVTKRGLAPPGDQISAVASAQSAFPPAAAHPGEAGALRLATSTFVAARRWRPAFVLAKAHDARTAS